MVQNRSYMEMMDEVDLGSPTFPEAHVAFSTTNQVSDKPSGRGLGRAAAQKSIAR